MTESNVNTLNDILTQTKAWAEAVEVLESASAKIKRLKFSSYDQILFIGCGSTYYLALSAAAMMQSATGIISRGMPSSELLLSPASVFAKGKQTLLCAISRSGTTTETLRAVEKFIASQQGALITITNHLGTPLSKMGKLNLVIPSGLEKNVAQTKSFASMYIAASGLAVLSSGSKNLLPAFRLLAPLGDNILNKYDSIASRFGKNQDFNQFFFLGSGANYGLACEASLKLKEISLTVSEPFHFMEFRHGPISMVNNQTVVVGLVSDENAAYELAVLSDAKKSSAQVLTLGENNMDIAFNSGLPESIRRVLYLPALQLMAYYRALSFGLDPDQPRHLSAVIELDLP